jgi:hypothetical protein
MLCVAWMEDTIKTDVSENVKMCTEAICRWAGCCEHGDEPSGSIIRGEFLDELTRHVLRKEGSV